MAVHNLFQAFFKCTEYQDNTESSTVISSIRDQTLITSSKKLNYSLLAMNLKARKSQCTPQP